MIRKVLIVWNTIWADYTKIIDNSLTYRFYLDRLSKKKAGLLKGFFLCELITTKKTKQETGTDL
jgi:hypothetical protein